MEGRLPPVAAFLFFLALGIATWAAPALAQGVYKSVDKDGRTVYSDAPPADTKAASVRKMDIPLDVLPEDKGLNSGAPVDPLAAASAVITMMRTVEGLQKMCAQESPELRERVRRAAAGWNARHDPLIQKADAVHKARLSTAEYQSLYRLMGGLQQSVDRRLSAMAPAQRTRTCDELPANLSSPRADLAANRQVVAALEPRR